LLKTTPPAARAAGSITPRGSPSAACNATDVTESSGIIAISARAAIADPPAAPKYTDGEVFSAVSANGNKTGARSTAFAANGSKLSAEDSRTPSASYFSAKISSGAAERRVKPAFSSFESRPN